MLNNQLNKNNDAVGNSRESYQRLRTFDFLRGLAILGVICVHTAQSFPSKVDLVDSALSLGRYGVQLFFLISALTMCYMWKKREGEINPVRNFYIRRFLRIAPLFLLSIPLYLYLNGFAANYWAPEGIGIKQIMLTASFLHGFWPDSINSVVPGGWSIAVEMTFYVFFPFLIIGIGGRKHIYLYVALLVWAFNVFIFQDIEAKFFAQNYVTSSATIVGDFLNLNFVSQAPIFFLGCYLFFTLNSKIQKSDILYLIVWALLATILRYAFTSRGLGFLTVCVGLCIFVFSCMKMNMRLRIFERLGKNSYAIYLTHFMVLHALSIILPTKNGFAALLSSLVLTTFFSYLLSMLTYRFIEKRIHSLSWRVTNTS